MRPCSGCFGYFAMLLDSAAQGPIGFDYLPVAVGVVFLVLA